MAGEEEDAWKAADHGNTQQEREEDHHVTQDHTGARPVEEQRGRVATVAIGEEPPIAKDKPDDSKEVNGALKARGVLVRARVRVMTPLVDHDGKGEGDADKVAEKENTKWGIALLSG